MNCKTLNSRNMSTAGWVLIIMGAVFIFIPGLFFWSYIQTLIAQGAASSAGATSAAGALALLNGTEGSPWMVTMAFFGLSFFITGGIFVAIASLGTELVHARTVPSQITRACTKCGTLVSSSIAFCPYCGSPMQRMQPMVPATS